MKAKTILHQSTYVIHKRPFCKEGQILVDCLTETNGLMRAVTTIGRSKKSQYKKAMLEPFSLLDGKFTMGKLPRLSEVSAKGPARFLNGLKLYAGLYINEITIKMLQNHEAEDAFFHHYHQCIESLSMIEEQALEPLLRHYEKGLLATIGFAIPYPTSIDPEKHYAFDPTTGFHPQTTDNPKTIQGQILIQLKEDALFNPNARKAAKRLHQSIIHQLCHTLHSRALIRPKSQTHKQSQ